LRGKRNNGYVRNIALVGSAYKLHLLDFYS